MVAQLDKLTPCIKTLQGNNRLSSPDIEGLKSTLKKGSNGSCKTFMGNTSHQSKYGLSESGRFYETGTIPKVSFDFSNLQLKEL
jgi:hypothetical protein